MSLVHYAKNFSTFALVGILFYGLAVCLNWIAIDLLDFNPYFAPFSIIFVLFVLKYYCYLAFGTIVPRFWRYTAANILITLASTFGIAYLVDYQNFSGGFASATSLAFFMGIRYLALYFLQVIRKPEHAKS